MSNEKENNLINSAVLLVGATVIVKIIGALYKIPLTTIIGGVGRGYFSTAYNIYTPVYAVSMAGLPIAVSKLVSQQMALQNFGTVKEIKKVAIKLFFLTGTLGTAFLFATARPYAKYIAGTNGVIPCILTIAPSIFFCCLMSAYRGYYEGQQNMKPTAISEIIEAFSKLIFGLSISFLFSNHLINEYNTLGTVLGTKAYSLKQAMSMIYPYTAAVSVFGVTIGTIIGFLYLLIIKPKPAVITNSKSTLSQKEIAKALIYLAIPIVAGSLIQNLSNLIDTATIQNRLEYALSIDNYNLIIKMYSQSLSISETAINDISTYLFGVYNSALDFKNLVPTVTLAIGISALPTMSRAWTLKDSFQISWIINSVLKFSLVIGLPVGLGMAALPREILTLVYGSSNADIIPIAAPIVKIYGLSMALFAVSGPLISTLQAIGKADVTVKSMAVGAVIKVMLNYILIGKPTYNINGAPISTISCFFVIVIWNLASIIKETKVKIKFKDCILKPFISSGICAVCAFLMFNVTVLKIGNNKAVLLSVIFGGIIYIILTLSLRIITKNELYILCKREKKRPTT